MGYSKEKRCHLCTSAFDSPTETRIEESFCMLIVPTRNSMWIYGLMCWKMMYFCFFFLEHCNPFSSDFYDFRRVRVVAKGVYFPPIMSVRLSACIGATFTARICVKFDIRSFRETLSRNSKFHQNRLLSFTWRRNYILLLLAKLNRHKTSFFPMQLCLIVDRDSVLGTATRYKPDGLGI
jgi:hypothetical protein